MEEYLLAAQDKITDVAFRKCMAAIEQFKSFTENSSKIEFVTQYLINQMEEVTPMALQKLLYFSQSFFSVLNNYSMFEDDCQAWIHGPVYPDVYKKYCKYGFEPIETSIFNRPETKLSFKELEVFDQVVKNFGRFSGKILERITHIEDPWINARGNLLPTDRSTNIISKESIVNYFSKVVVEYNIITVGDIDSYCNAMYMRV
jgi:uncharacterized phage-associated protein